MDFFPLLFRLSSRSLKNSSVLFSKEGKTSRPRIPLHGFVIYMRL